MIEYKIYKLTNTVTGMCYIGYTTRRLCDRWDEHTANSRGGRKRSSKLYVAIAKYGSASFVKDLLATAQTLEEAKRLEAKYIKLFDSCHNGYNSNLGGCGFLDYPKHLIQKSKESKLQKQMARENGLPDVAAKPPARKEFWESGKKNPMAKTYRVQCPNGEEVIVTGIKQFCRERNILVGDMCGKYGRSKGYLVLERLNDYPLGEYTQASGSGEAPNRSVI
jgi:hypothetical protein